MKKITSLLLTSLIFLGLNVSPIKNDAIKINDELKVEKAFPAHRLSSKDYYERIDELLEHHEKRISECLNIIKENPEWREFLQGKDLSRAFPQNMIAGLGLLQKDDLSPDNKARVGSRLAVIYLFENKPQEALDVLEATNAPALLPATNNPRKIIAARAYSALDKPDEALALLEDDYSKNGLLHRFEIYWKAQDWDNASNTIKYLIEEPKPGQKLSSEQMNYILDWATTLKQAGKETVLVRLRNKFLPYFKDTPFYSAFNVLTNHLEKEKIDINAINSAITDIQNFSNFSKFYTDSLKESDLE